MADPKTIYKMTVLHMLDCSDGPLTNTQIVNFFLDMNYTDYFVVQQVLKDLVRTELIRPESTYSNTRYRITSSGREMLKYFQSKVPIAISSDVADFFKKNKMVLRRTNAVFADYDQTTDHNYAVRCRIREKDVTTVDLTLTVKTKSQAEAICTNWNKKHEDIYALLMDNLLQ